MNHVQLNTVTSNDRKYDNASTGRFLSVKTGSEAWDIG